MKSGGLLLLLFGLFFCKVESYSQNYFGIRNEEFGKSRVQVKRMDWKTIKTSNFEFNFYRGGEEIAKKAARKAEEEHEKITEILGYTPFSVMKVFIYNTPDDKNQSNIGLVAPMDLDGKVLNLSKARIQIAYQKNDSLFYKELIEEVSTLFVYDMLYGGSLKEAVQSQLLLMVPDWYIKGIAAYIADNKNNKYKFEEFKIAIARLENQKLSGLKGEDAQIIGQSIWNYIALKYGKDNISNILNLTRIIRNEQSSITSTLGVSFPKFLREWRGFYVNPVVAENVSLESIENKETKKYLEPEKTGLKNLKPEEIDTDFYEFDQVNVDKFRKDKKNIDEAALGSKNETEILKGKTQDKVKMSAIKAYSNQLVSNGNDVFILVDPVRRLSIGSKFVFNDLLENNVLTASGSVRPSTPFFKSYDLNLSYGNYSKKIDWIFNYDKRSINFESVDESNIFLFRALKLFLLEDNPSISRRLVYQKLSATGVYPFSPNLKLSVSPGIIKTTDIEYDIFDLAKNRPNRNEVYFSPAIELVYDKTKVTSSNGYELGTKAKIFYQKFSNIGNNSLNFNKLNIDIRHYQPIVRGVLAAGRFNFGKSTGSAPKYTFLGGAENWLNRSIYDTRNSLPGKAGDMRDILFYNFAGNLRGFDFARLYGNNHLLTNIELRAYMSEYFPRSSMSSTLLRSLQFVAFTDIGTAWNGSSGPFSRQNSLNTIEIGADGNSPFFAEVTNFKNPFLMGIGVGARTTILGVLVKVDYAVGKEDKEYNNPKLYVSIGKDF